MVVCYPFDLGDDFAHAECVPSRATAGEVPTEWLGDVPLVAALSGKTTTFPTAWHRRLQWSAILLALLLIGAVLAGWFWHAGVLKPVPSTIRIASAQPGGRYYDLSQRFGDVLSEHSGRVVTTLPTSGSVENNAKLLAGDAELALLQAGAIQSGKVAIVAPLYEDLIHIVVRRGSGIQSIGDLAGQRVSIGMEESGMQLSAKRLLGFYNLDVSQLSDAHVHFNVLRTDPSYAAAIVTTGPANQDLQDLLRSGQYHLLSIPQRDRERLTGPVFHSRTILQGAYVSDDTLGEVPREDVQTVATTTFLAAHARTSHQMVRLSLETLYLNSDLVTKHGLFSRRDAAQWRLLGLHPVAREFFSQTNPD